MSGFARSWTAEVLTAAPMIAPARQYMWPLRIAGEEDALARGALQLMVRPRGGGAYLVSCALGFTDPAMPSGVYGCPDEDEICAVAGGYAYVARAAEPERCTQVSLKPVVKVLEAGGLLVFVGFHSMAAWGVGGLAWTSGRLSWEGVQVGEIVAGELRGSGWDLISDREVEFGVDLRTGRHWGGAFGG